MNRKKKPPLKRRRVPTVVMSARVNPKVKKCIIDKYGSLGVALDVLVQQEKSAVRRYGKDTEETSFILPSFNTAKRASKR